MRIRTIIADAPTVTLPSFKMIWKILRSKSRSRISWMPSAMSQIEVRLNIVETLDWADQYSASAFIIPVKRLQDYTKAPVQFDI